MPAMFSFTIPVVIDGVRSSTTIIVPFGALLMSASSMPSSTESIPFFMSLTSVARCIVSSSPVDSNIVINISQMVSRAFSALLPDCICFSISEFIYGSCSIAACPIIISASFSPTELFICSAFAIVCSTNLFKACLYLSISCSGVASVVGA